MKMKKPSLLLKGSITTVAMLWGAQTQAGGLASPMCLAWLSEMKSVKRERMKKHTPQKTNNGLGNLMLKLSGW